MKEERNVMAALRRMGFEKDQMTAHGFRAMASTILNEQGWPPDVIERQLAHVEGNSVRAAYNHAEYLPGRRKMMQHWANWLDGLKQGPVPALNHLLNLCMDFCQIPNNSACEPRRTRRRILSSGIS
ncbi:MAG: tyrosine-type recombinase/integrase [Synergistaceae bacterium]|nr:tyrosine-type recombinase/integrase [Synergistaceae bacterium]